MRKFEGRTLQSIAGQFTLTEDIICPGCGREFKIARSDRDSRVVIGGHWPSIEAIGLVGSERCPLSWADCDDVIAWRLDCLLDLLEGE